MEILHAELPSCDGRTQLSLVVWSVARPRAVVQLTHGMAESIERYDEFARALCQAGLLVVGYDLLGHGASVTDEEEWGHYDRRGREHLLADIDSVRRLCAEACGEGVPYVLFGHSMGSFLVRAYLARQGQGVAGAILCGTGSPSIPASGAGYAVATTLGLVFGMRHRSKLVDGLAVGSYNRAFEPTRTSCDWLSRNEASVDAYVADPRDGFTFTVGGYRMLTSLTALVARRRTFRQTPANLPLLLISGTCDPVGDFGAGPRKVCRLYRDTGHADTTLRLYEGDRHEVLQELDRASVFEDVIDWIDSNVLSGRGTAAGTGAGR